jgi:hypothetical protein
MQFMEQLSQSEELESSYNGNQLRAKYAAEIIMDGENRKAH